MHKSSVVFIVCSLFLVGCNATQPAIPSRNIGITGFSTAFTLMSDMNPPEGLSQIIGINNDSLCKLASSDYSTIIEDVRLGNFRIQTVYGGATVMSPRHLVLTDHQILWQSAHKTGSVYLVHMEPSLNFAKIIAHEKTIAGGLTLIELLLPFQMPHMIEIADNPDQYRGRNCLIVVSRSTFLGKNPEASPSKIASESDDIMYIRGSVLTSNDRLSQHIESDYFTNDNFTIRIKDDIDLNGASGFPVLVYDKNKEEWVMLAISISGREEVFENQSDIVYIHASRPGHKFMNIISTNRNEN